MHALNGMKKDVIAAFLGGKSRYQHHKANGPLRNEGNTLWWKGPSDQRDNGQFDQKHSELLAIRRDDGNIVVNTERLKMTQATWSYGYTGSNTQDGGTMTELQEILLADSRALPLPFNALRAAGCDPMQVEVIDQGAAEEVHRDMRTPDKRNEFRCYKKDDEGKPILDDDGQPRFTVRNSISNWELQSEAANGKHWEETYLPPTPADMGNTHFTGATLFNCLDDKGYDRVFLFDIDREEIKHSIFNPFITEINYRNNLVREISVGDEGYHRPDADNAYTGLVETSDEGGTATMTEEQVQVKMVPQKPKSIAEAYELLKPEKVKMAELEGKSVIRQGEWFFIDADMKDLPEFNEAYEAELKEKASVDISSEEYGLVEAPEDAAWSIAVKKEGRYGVLNLLPKGEFDPNAISSYLHAAQAKQEAKDKLKGLDAFKPSLQWLRVGNNRPNSVSEVAKRIVDEEEVIYCRGSVQHSGREHRPIMLPTWHIAMPNTSVASFNIIGDID